MKEGIFIPSFFFYFHLLKHKFSKKMITSCPINGTIEPLGREIGKTDQAFITRLYLTYFCRSPILSPIHYFRRKWTNAYLFAKQCRCNQKRKVGFSWTTFFFGFLPALFRGDLKWAVIMFLIAAAIGAFTFGIGAWVSGIVFSFVYNKIYIKELLEKGYRPANAESQAVLERTQIVAPAA
ncbi:hypothetical protein [Paenibacillus sp. 7516]|uniref:hypothetical protein n=1 Tax=Paenibacillus sp. 7516 TaxID=2022549 RepID=UPI00268843A7